MKHKQAITTRGPIRLKKELQHLFLPIIRYRGKKYARSGRVKIHTLEDGRISSTVRGTINYKVNISLDENDHRKIRIGCTCPFFRQGIPCKHIWASICVADQLLAKLPDKGFNRAKPAALDIDKVFLEEFWKTGKEGIPWKPVQDFVIRYRLAVEDHSLSISVFEQYIKKDGTPGRTRRINSKSLERPGLPRQDRLLLPFLRDLAEKSSFYPDFGLYGTTAMGMETILVRPTEAGVILPMLAETKRCQVVLQENSVTVDPLLMAAEPGASLEINASPVRGKRISLEPGIVLVYDDEKQVCRFDQVYFLNSEPVYFIFRNFLYELDGPAYAWIKRVQEGGLPQVSPKKIPGLVRQSAAVTGKQVLKLPKELAPDRADDIQPELHVTLEFASDKLQARPHLEYDGCQVEPGSPGDTICDYPRWKLIIRNRNEEKRLMQLLNKVGFEQATKLADEQHLYQLPIEKASDALTRLEKNGVILEAENRKRFRTGSVKSFKVTSGIDWFDIDAEISFGREAVSLPKLVQAYLKGKKTITLSSGDQGILPTAWLEEHIQALELAKIPRQKGKNNNTLRFSMSHALLIDQMLHDAADVSVDRNFAAIRKKISSFSGIKPKDPPCNFRGTLRSYQKDAMGWFSFLDQLGFGGILADDMGLGKTVQVLAWLLEKLKDDSELPSLVVAPTSLVFNWQAEAEKFTPDLKIVPYLGANRNESLETCQDGDILLTTYGIVRRDIAALSKIQFNYAILDESQHIKNPDSVISKAVRLIKARHRLCLTGTPLENHIGELWSQMEFLNPGILGTRERFMKRFAKPLSQGEDQVLQTLKQLVKPFILRRTKEQVAQELPEKQETIIRCAMTPEQEKLYFDVRDHYRATILQAVAERGIKRSKMKVLEGLLRLRQAANHPALIGADHVDSGKFLQLMDLLEETVEGGHKVLVFSQFTRMLGIIKKRLLERGLNFEYLDGRTPQGRRQQKVENFQRNDNVKLFLISLRAGGVGLNLTAADYVFIVDPWWNPAVELQAIDRTHRIGQKRKVVTYRLISRNTVEEKVLKLQEKKQKIVGSILSGSQNMLSSLSAQDLEVLFS